MLAQGKDLPTADDTTSMPLVSRHRVSIAVLLCAVASLACRRATADEVARLLDAEPPPNLLVNHECRNGERGWDYICVARYLRAPDASESARRFPVPAPRRTGLKITTYYKGRPAFNSMPMPIDGPVLSENELILLIRKGVTSQRPPR